MDRFISSTALKFDVVGVCQSMVVRGVVAAMKPVLRLLSNARSLLTRRSEEWLGHQPLGAWRLAPAYAGCACRGRSGGRGRPRLRRRDAF